MVGCATSYDVFKAQVRVGMTTKELEARLNNIGAPFTYYTCSDAAKILSAPKIECLEPTSIGLYKGLANDGSYLLGIGSSDVAFQIEIGGDSTISDIRTDYVYTFL
jgi:hypothetical protein